MREGIVLGSGEMAARMTGLALLLLVGVFSGGVVAPASAQEDSTWAAGTASGYQYCDFHMNIRPKLWVSECSPGYYSGTKGVNVYTNTNAQVLLAASPYLRYERDCDNQYTTNYTYDAIAAYAYPTALWDLNPTGGGAPISADHWGWYDDGWYRGYSFCVGTHNGGFRLEFSSYLFDWNAPYDLKNDAGCYTSWVYAGFSSLPVSYCSDAWLWY